MNAARLLIEAFHPRLPRLLDGSRPHWTARVGREIDKIYPYRWNVPDDVPWSNFIRWPQQLVNLASKFRNTMVARIKWRRHHTSRSVTLLTFSMLAYHMLKYPLKRLQWLFPQIAMIEWWFNFSNALPVANCSTPTDNSWYISFGIIADSSMVKLRCCHLFNPDDIT